MRVPERRRRVSTERGGGETEAGERETLPETGGRTHGAKKGDTCRHEDIRYLIPHCMLNLCFTLQRLEEIMKRTRRSDTAEKVTVTKCFIGLTMKSLRYSWVFIPFTSVPVCRKLFRTGMETMKVTHSTHCSCLSCTRRTAVISFSPLCWFSLIISLS